MRVLFVFGEKEQICNNDSPEIAHLRSRLGLFGPIGNGIRAAAVEMAQLLRSRGHLTELVCVQGESHATLKPSLISRGFSWLEDSAWSDLPDGLAEPRAEPPMDAHELQLKLAEAGSAEPSAVASMKAPGTTLAVPSAAPAAPP